MGEIIESAGGPGRLVRVVLEAGAINLLVGILGNFPKIIVFPYSSTVKLFDLST